MTDLLQPDLCVIGAGPAAFAVAAAALAVGAGVVVVDRDPEGEERARGAELAAAALAAIAADGSREFSPAALAAELRRLRARLDPPVSRERLIAMNATMLQGRIRFVSPRVAEVGGRRVAARRFVLATGATLERPSLPGLELVRPLTREALAGLDSVPPRLIVLGADGEALETAQTFARLGSRVTLVRGADGPWRLEGIDDEFLDVALAALVAEGVEIRLGQATAIEPDGAGVRLAFAAGEPDVADALYLCCGRRPDLGDLGLEVARVRHGPAGLEVRHDLRTTNRRIYAVGEVIDGRPDAHASAEEAAVVVRAALFRLPARLRREQAVRTMRTRPAIAVCGLDEAAARARHRTLSVARAAFSVNEAAIVSGETRGHVRVIADRRGRILGAGIVGRNAEELIATWQIAMSKGMRMQDVASLAPARSSLSETSRQAAVAAMMSRLRNPWVSRGLRLARWLG